MPHRRRRQGGQGNPRVRAAARMRCVTCGRRGGRMPGLRCLLAVVVIAVCIRSAVTADRDAELMTRHRALASAQQRRTADVPALLAAYQASLSAAKATRPSDPVVDWLSGDLLMSVGGEPD